MSTTETSLSPSLPDRVDLCEVGPRDGFQMEETFIPTELKLETIRALAAAGLPRIQVTSFVHPKWVPQMRDAEQICDQLPMADGLDGATLTGLALNRKGLERAVDAGCRHIDLSIATHDDHSMDNANMLVAEAVAEGTEMVKDARAENCEVQMNFQTVFGYREPGDTPIDHVVDLASRFAELGVESISLADSTGMGNPVAMRRVVGAVQDAIGDTPLVLHLHDTRGLGLANLVAALEMGVTRFDTSLAGMGGCPFIEGATGNIATEDTAYLLDQMGVETDIDLPAVAQASSTVEQFLDTSFPGKMHRLLLHDATSKPAEASA
ncbi:hydroxymethylglutaryl-CoA lyase [Longibacter salinarum]|uniref:Hydroxymethylglutaryl-CoA lyase n=1 Tax=Longibacter salinarum TaxID=1850348 RepID=A0A2A8CY73_9BACT|nr:hydroxymethylglutaryl-CoA lyase [Longibacter salinarum]PEN13679.1 hydroxymethylglutaryl-CoA lyase [Longibacter salinarum]